MCVHVCALAGTRLKYLCIELPDSSQCFAIIYNPSKNRSKKRTSKTPLRQSRSPFRVLGRDRVTGRAHSESLVMGKFFLTCIYCLDSEVRIKHRYWHHHRHYFRLVVVNLVIKTKLGSFKMKDSLQPIAAYPAESPRGRPCPESPFFLPGPLATFCYSGSRLGGRAHASMVRS